MANRERGEVTLEAGGESYILRLGTNELCEVEEESGIKIGALEKELKDPSIRLLRALLWAGLNGGGRKHTLAEAGRLMDMTDPTTVGGKIGEAIEAAFPSGNDEPKNPTRAGKSGAGKNS